MDWLIREKSFYQRIAVIALPVALQNVVNLSINLMDTVMIGTLGDIELAATAAANQFYFVLTILIFGVASGSNVMSAQYWGKRNPEAVRGVFSLAYLTTIVMSLCFTAVAFLFPEWVLFLFTDDPVVIAMGAQYLRPVSFTYLFASMSSCTFMMLRSVGAVNVSVVVSVITLVANVFWNWVFIFGHLGAPALGVVGAAVGTLIARTLEFLIVVFYMVRLDKKVLFRFKSLVCFDRKLAVDFVTNVYPVLFNDFLWALGASALTAIIGRMSTDFLAANSVVSVVTQLVGVFVMGLANAAAVIIGNTIGQGKHQQIAPMTRTLLLLSLVVGLISGLILLILRPFILTFYGNLSPLTLSYIGVLMGLVSVIVVAQSVGGVAMMGILRGGGDARFVLLADTVFMWFICIPFGFLGAFFWGWSVPLVYFVIRCDEILKVFLGVIRVLQGRWIKDVTL